MDLCSTHRILRIVGYRQCENSWKYLDYPKIFSYPMKMWQKIFIPHENVAKYFGTPPMFHSTPVPGIKNDRSLSCYENTFISDIGQMCK